VDPIDAISIMALQGAKAAMAVPAAWVARTAPQRRSARFTAKWFSDRGFTPTDSQTNFLFIDIRRLSRGFREACAKDGVIIGATSLTSRPTRASRWARWRRCSAP
jgi:histidinol-phosphate/aromatic aminotransferase/cobyric acid decarboxylase-like protein